MIQNSNKQLYQSYLIRCWTTPATGKERQPTQRFILETVSAPPHRQGFDSLAELLAFLQVELEADAYNHSAASRK